jgi:TrmH family RNA methyltransferase
VTEALDAGARVSFAVASPRLSTLTEGSALGRRLEEHDCTLVDDPQFGEVSDTDHPQGVLLVCEEPASEASDLADPGRFLLLDAIQDPGNVGTLVRSAVAFGLDGVVCLDGTVDPWGSKAVRASAGMMFRIPIVRCGVGDALAALAARDATLVVASSEGEDAACRRGMESFGLVVGNEGTGVREELREAAQVTVAVSMQGAAESLNVGIAGSILMHMLTSEGV